jgi:hypothetical protein
VRSNPLKSLFFTEYSSVVLFKHIFVTTGAQMPQSKKIVGHGPDDQGSTPVRGHDVLFPPAHCVKMEAKIN